jgi:hypothetical protein
MMNKQSRKLQLTKRSLCGGGVENFVKLRGNGEWAMRRKESVCLRYDGAAPVWLVGAIARGT